MPNGGGIGRDVRSFSFVGADVHWLVQVAVADW